MFEPGQQMVIRSGTFHANPYRLSLLDHDDRRKRFEGRAATFVRYMAGGDIANRGCRGVGNQSGADASSGRQLSEGIHSSHRMIWAKPNSGIEIVVPGTH